MSWEKVKLGNVLKQYRIEHLVQEKIDYKQVTISKHDGVRLRGIKNGKDIGRKRQFIIDLVKYPNTFMFVRQGVQDGSLGIAPLEVDGCIATENMPMFSVENIEIEYLKLVIVSRIFKNEVSKITTTGSAQKSIHENQLLEVEIPFPSTKEQLEIVKAFSEIENKNLEIATELTHQLDLVKKLKQQLLNDAVQGKLVPQNFNDEPASALLARIKTEKAQSGKKEKPFPPITDAEIPFEIPDNWIWCRLGEICRITGGGTPSMANEEYWNGNIPWISPKDMWVDFVRDSEMKITSKAVLESAANLIPIGSLLIVGRSGILKRKLPVAINEIECTVNQDIKVVIPHLVLMNRYLQLMFNGMEKRILQNYVKYGMTVHSLKYDEFSQMPIPIPPLAEQARIVEKLEHLMAQCNALETHITESAALNEQLLQQVLREALQSEK